MSDETTFSVGELRSPSVKDHSFASVEEAEIFALKKGDNNIYGVWCNDDGELVAIVYLGTGYYP